MENQAEENNSMAEIEKKITQRELTTMKLENKRKEAEQQLTFKPQLVAKRTEGGESAAPSRFDKLYQDALKRQQDNDKKVTDVPTFTPKISSRASSRSKRDASPASERLYQAASSKEKPAPSVDPEATFKPQISKRANSVNRNKSVDINDRLYQMSKDHQDRLERLRQSVNEQTTAECTFVPKIRPSSSSKSRPTGNGAPADSATDVTQRLLSFEEKRLNKLEEARKLLLEEQSKETTFKPVIKLTKRSATPSNSSETIFERLSKQVLEKDQRNPLSTNGLDLDRDKSMHSLNGGATGSTTHSTTTTSNGKVFQRLSSTPSRREVESQLDRIKQDMEMAECTFKPQLHIPDKLNMTHNPERNSKPVYIRLSEEAEKMREEQKKREELKLQEEMKEATFSPALPVRHGHHSTSSHNLNDSTVSSKSSMSMMTSSSNATIFERLSAEADKLKLDHMNRVEAQRQEELKDVTFSPHLNSKSIQLGSKSSKNATATTHSGSNAIFERLSAEAEKLKQEHQMRVEAQRQEELRDATFTPQLNSKSIQLGSKNKKNSTDTTQTGSTAIFERLSAEAETMKQEHQMRVEAQLEEELRDATFTPLLNAKSVQLGSKSSKRTVVPSTHATSTPPTVSSYTPADAVADTVGAHGGVDDHHNHGMHILNTFKKQTTHLSPHSSTDETDNPSPAVHEMTHDHDPLEGSEVTNILPTKEKKGDNGPITPVKQSKASQPTTPSVEVKKTTTTSTTPKAKENMNKSNITPKPVSSASSGSRDTVSKGTSTTTTVKTSSTGTSKSVPSTKSVAKPVVPNTSSKTIEVKKSPAPNTATTTTTSSTTPISSKSNVTSQVKSVTRSSPVVVAVESKPDVPMETVTDSQDPVNNNGHDSITHQKSEDLNAGVGTDKKSPKASGAASSNPFVSKSKTPRSTENSTHVSNANSESNHLDKLSPRTAANVAELSAMLHGVDSHAAPPSATGKGHNVTDSITTTKKTGNQSTSTPAVTNDVVNKPTAAPVSSAKPVSAGINTNAPIIRGKGKSTKSDKEENVVDPSPPAVTSTETTKESARINSPATVNNEIANVTINEPIIPKSGSSNNKIMSYASILTSNDKKDITVKEVVVNQTPVPANTSVTMASTLSKGDNKVNDDRPLIDLSSESDTLPPNTQSNMKAEPLISVSNTSNNNGHLSKTPRQNQINVADMSDFSYDSTPSTNKGVPKSSLGNQGNTGDILAKIMAIESRISSQNTTGNLLTGRTLSAPLTPTSATSPRSVTPTATSPGSLSPRLKPVLSYKDLVEASSSTPSLTVYTTPQPLNTRNTVHHPLQGLTSPIPHPLKTSIASPVSADIQKENNRDVNHTQETTTVTKPTIATPTSNTSTSVMKPSVDSNEGNLLDFDFDIEQLKQEMDQTLYTQEKSNTTHLTANLLNDDDEDDDNDGDNDDDDAMNSAEDHSATSSAAGRTQDVFTIL